MIQRNYGTIRNRTQEFFVKNDSLEKGGMGRWEQGEQLRRKLLITRHAPGYAGHVKFFEIT